jgi:TolB protein
VWKERVALVLSGWLLSASVLAATPHTDRIVYVGDPSAHVNLFIADASKRWDERRLLADSFAAYNPSFSADGSWVVFTSDRAGSADIYRVHPDGSGLERLTDSPSFDDQGALSPDGGTLAFVSTRGGGTANIWLLNLAQHTYFNLTQSRSGNFRPSWSPTGQWLAFTSDRAEPHGRSGPDRAPPAGSGCCGWELVQSTALYMVHPDGSGLRRLTPIDRFAGSPKWSPDGRHIVCYFDDRTVSQYQSRVVSASQIVSIDIDTGAKQILTADPAMKWSPQYINETKIGYLTLLDGKRVLADTAGWIGPRGDIANPSWSPDGRFVVYAKRMGNAGPKPDPILQAASRDPQFELYRTDDWLAYSPDGRQVLFAGSFIGDEALRVMNADGTDHRTIFDASAQKVGIVSPAWSRDGRFIAFTMGRFGLRNPSSPAQIATIRSDGSEFRILTHGPNNSGYPSFSPDGRRIVYRVLGGEDGLRILSLPEGKVTRLTTDHDDFPEWSPMGDRIVFTGFHTGDFEIYTIRPDGTRLQQLTRDHGNDAHAMWSPDGRSILFTSSRCGWKDETLLGGARSPQSYGEIFVMREDGTDLRQLTDDQWEESADAWLPQVR